MDVTASLIKLKPNSREKVAAWKKDIERLKNEAIASLKHEGVIVESWFGLTIEGEDYLLAYMRAEDTDKAHEAVLTSELEVDKVHGQFKKDAWHRSGHIDCELLVDITTD